MAWSSTLRRNRGLTLVELLLVLAITAVLMSVSIPLIRPAFENRILREASRQINAFFAGARARAAATGRPVGVWLERSVDATGATYCSQLFMAEASPAITGATLDSRVQVSDTGVLIFSEVDKFFLGTLLSPDELFRIQFDYKGPRYIGQRSLSGLEFILVDISGGRPPGTEPGGRGLPYAITRAPTRTSVSPLALPGDAVVDLTVSGLGANGSQMNSVVDPETATPVIPPVIIEFSPSGNVDYVFVDNTSRTPFSPVHLLIGRRSKVVVPDPDSVDLSDPEIANLADPSNLWITVGHRTGSVVTTENADTSHLPNGSTPTADRIQVAREFARTSIRKGGR